MARVVYAYCNANGAITIGATLPPASLPLARGEYEAVLSLITNTASHEPLGLAVPGMARQTTVRGRLCELNAYRGWLALLIKQGAPERGKVAVWRSPETEEAKREPINP